MIVALYEVGRISSWSFLVVSNLAYITAGNLNCLVIFLNLTVASSFFGSEINASLLALQLSSLCLARRSGVPNPAKQLGQYFFAWCSILAKSRLSDLIQAYPSLN